MLIFDSQITASPVSARCVRQIEHRKARSKRQRTEGAACMRSASWRSQTGPSQGLRRSATLARFNVSKWMPCSRNLRLWKVPMHWEAGGSRTGQADRPRRTSMRCKPQRQSDNTPGQMKSAFQAACSGTERY